MASYRNIINPKHIGEYQPPNESKKSEPYQIRRREVTNNDMRQIPNIINLSLIHISEPTRPY